MSGRVTPSHYRAIIRAIDARIQAAVTELLTRLFL